jgi:hypothetical protein
MSVQTTKPKRPSRGLPWPIQLTLDIALSPVVFFLLQGPFDLSTTAALTASVLVGAAWTLVMLAITSKFNAVSLCVIAGLVVGVVLTAVTGDARFGVVKDSFYTGVFGLAMLVSLAARRPLMFYLIRPFATEDNEPSKVAEWNESWVSPLFRRCMRVMTVAWGIGLLVEAGSRAVIVYGGLSIDVAAALSPGLTGVVLVSLMSWTAYYGKNAGEARRLTESAANVSALSC